MKPVESPIDHHVVEHHPHFPLLLAYIIPDFNNIDSIPEEEWENTMDWTWNITSDDITVFEVHEPDANSKSDYDIWQHGMIPAEMEQGSLPEEQIAWVSRVKDVAVLDRLQATIETLWGNTPKQQEVCRAMCQIIEAWHAPC